MKKQIAIMAALFFVGGMGSALAIEETKTPPGPPSPRIDSIPGPTGEYDYQGEEQIQSGEDLVDADREKDTLTDVDKKQQQQVATVSQDQIDFQAANDIDGMPILNEQGQQIGEVDKVLVDMNRGELAYVVVTGGGVLGVGEEKYVVPWKAVKTDTQHQGLVVTAKSDDLKTVEAGGEFQNQIDRQMGEEIHQYYGVSPYWEEGQKEQQKDKMNKESDMMKQDINGGAEK